MKRKDFFSQFTIVLRLVGEAVEDKIDNLIGEVLELEINKESNICLFVSSVGGESGVCYALYTLLRERIGEQLTTFGAGEIASAVVPVYLAGKKRIPVLVTNQVYADFEDKDKVNLVGGDLLKYGSKCLVELQITPSGNRRAIVRKHRSIKEEKEITFKIVEGGIIGTKEGRGFKLF